VLIRELGVMAMLKATGLMIVVTVAVGVVLNVILNVI
ncbi:hypothetical protein C5S36_10850, partial [Candidatus Methanophagaceae archaeon]